MNFFENDATNIHSEVDFYHNFTDYPLYHDHNYFEFFFITNGSYKHVINGKEFIMKKNDAFFIRPKDYHAIFNNEENSSHVNIMFKVELVKRICDSYSDKLYNIILNHDIFPISLSENQTRKIINYTMVLRNSFSLDVDRSLVSSLLLSYILEKTIYQHDILFSDKPQWLTELLLKISLPVNAHWNAQDVVKNVNYSRTHFSRKFKEYMGTTLIQYLTEVKMAYAQELIMYSDMNITEISNTLGYQNVSSFNHVFKSTYSMSPMQFKKRAKKI